MKALMSFTKGSSCALSTSRAHSQRSKPRHYQTSPQILAKEESGEKYTHSIHPSKPHEDDRLSLEKTVRLFFVKVLRIRVVSSLKDALSVAVLRAISTAVPPTKTWAYENLVKKHAESPSASIDMVEGVVREMRQDRIAPSLEAYNTAIKSVANRGVLTKIIQFRDLMEEDGVQADMTTFEYFLRAVLGLRFNPRHIQLYLFKNIYDEILDRGLDFSAEVLILLLEGFSRHLHEPITSALFDKYKSLYFPRTSQVYDPMLRLYSRLHMGDKLNAILVEMIQFGIPFTSNSNRYLVDYHIRWNDLDQVKRLIKRMRQDGPIDSPILSAILRFYFKKGHYADASALLTEMIKEGEEISVDVYMQVYGLDRKGVKLDIPFHLSFKYLLKHLPSWESTETVMHALIEMEPQPDLNIFPILLRQFAIEKDLENTKFLLKYLTEAGKIDIHSFLNEEALRAVNHLFYNEMLKSISDGDKIDELLYDKIRLGLRISELDYSVLISHYEHTEDPRKIWKLVDKMQEDGYHVSNQLLSSLASLYTKKLEHANFHRVLRIADRVGYSRSSIINSVLQRLNKENRSKPSDSHS